jgi:hypothetical protein
MVAGGSPKIIGSPDGVGKIGAGWEGAPTEF